MTSAHKDPSATRILLAFTSVYLIWGSTYLAIRLAIDTMPPFLMAGARFTLAGALLFLWTWFRTRERPTAAHWRSAFIAGGLLLVGGNGGVVWGEQTVSTGVVSLLVATVPLWIVILSRTRPDGRVVIGLVTGVLIGEPARLHLAAISARSVAAFGYLVIFGSLIGFTSYIRLFKVVAPAKVATYACVNPIVAVVLGRLFLGEPIGPRTLIASAIIVSAVVLITKRASSPSSAPRPT